MSHQYILIESIKEDSGYPDVDRKDAKIHGRRATSATLPPFPSIFAPGGANTGSLDKCPRSSTCISFPIYPVSCKAEKGTVEDKL
jgi:hypothetical protein